MSTFVEMNTDLDIGEARVIWLALSVFRTRCHESDESIVGRTMDKIESLYSREEWSEFNNRFHGKYVVGVDIDTEPDPDPIPCDNADAAIEKLRRLINEYNGEVDSDISDISASDIAYGFSVRAKENEDIRFWIIPDISLQDKDLTNAQDSDSIQT